jgi:hypothetical protein
MRAEKLEPQIRFTVWKPYIETLSRCSPVGRVSQYQSNVDVGVGQSSMAVPSQLAS